MDAFANPFFVLGATPRDRKPRLQELAEEQALHGDGEAAANARNTLTNPRNRLAAEVGWFPGVAPGRIEAALQTIRAGGPPEPDVLPPLCQANLVLTRLAAGGGRDAVVLKNSILRVATLVEQIDAAAVMLAINEDRQVSAFPQVTDLAAVEHEIGERVRHYQRSLTALLDDLPTAAMVQSYERLMVEGAVAGAPVPRLIAELLAAYELHAGEFLAAEAERILGLLDATKAAADARAPLPQVRENVQRAVAALADWDRVAQPIQLARQNAGLAHDDSHRLAFRARSLAVHLFNAHDYLDDAKLLSSALQKLFAEVTAVSDVVGEDLRALGGIEAQRQAQLAEASAAKAKFAAEVTWETTFGMLFKDKFRMSPDGIEFKGRMTPAEQIGGLAWGAVRMIRNGRDAGTIHHFRYGTPVGTIEIVLDNEAQYGELVPRVWRAYCVPLLLKMMDRWRAGEGISIGGHEVRDEGIALKLPHMFKKDEWRLFPWTAMRKNTHGGSLTFLGDPEKDFKAEFVFRETLNAHILDFAVGRVWEGKADRLSRIFDEG